MCRAPRRSRARSIAASSTAVSWLAISSARASRNDLSAARRTSVFASFASAWTMSSARTPPAFPAASIPRVFSNAVSSSAVSTCSSAVSCSSASCSAAAELSHACLGHVGGAEDLDPFAVERDHVRLVVHRIPARLDRRRQFGHVLLVHRLHPDALQLFHGSSSLNGELLQALACLGEDVLGDAALLQGLIVATPQVLRPLVARLLQCLLEHGDVDVR